MTIEEDRRISEGNSRKPVMPGILHKPKVNESGVLYYGIYLDPAGEIPDFFRNNESLDYAAQDDTIVSQGRELDYKGGKG